jgi:hypothetical protein
MNELEQKRAQLAELERLERIRGMANANAPSNKQSTPTFIQALQSNLDYNGKIADYAHRMLEMIKTSPDVAEFVKLMEEMQQHSLTRQ